MSRSVYINIITIVFNISQIFPIKNPSKIFSYLSFQLSLYSLFSLVAGKVFLLSKNTEHLFNDSYARVFTSNCQMKLNQASTIKSNKIFCREILDSKS